jgi:hypothetical protein
MPNAALPDSFIDSLVQVLGRENVLTDPYDLDRYSGDALSPTRAFGAEDSFERLADVVARWEKTGGFFDGGNRWTARDICPSYRCGDRSGHYRISERSPRLGG